MSVDLVPSWQIGDVSLTSYPFGVDADSTVDIGEPEMVVEGVTSMVADGDLERVVRYGNRAYVLEVYIEDPTLGDLASSESLLRTEIRRTGLLLTHDPGDGFSPASVYEVQTAKLTPHRRDDHESHLIRQFTLTLTCAPWARSVDAVTVESLPPPPLTPTTVTIADADTITGWSANANTGAGSVAVTVVDEGASVRASSASCFSLSLGYGPPSPVALTGSTYLLLETPTVATSFYVLYAGDSAVTWIAPTLSRLLSSGNIQHALAINGSRSLSYVGMNWSSSAAGVPGPTSASLAVADVSRTDMLPNVSPRQLSRILEVGGTERTPASLRVFTSSGYLGASVVHTTTFDGSAYSPDMRRWRSSGNTTAANTGARRITGVWEPLKPNPVISRTPAHSLPRGDYLLCAAIKSDTATTNEPLPISWAVKSVISGQTIDSIEGTGYGWFPVAHELTIVPIAAMPAPVVRSGALDVEVHLLNPTATVDLQVEEWWMFKDDEGSALSIVNTSEGNLWLDSPDSDSAVPTVWVGPEKPLSYHPSAGLVSQGLHTFEPGLLMLTTISDSNDYLQAELTYHERWHSNAAR